MTLTNKPQVVAVVKGSARPAHKPVSTTTPIASKFAIKLSEMLRRSSRQKRDHMIEQLIVSGVTEVDGWSLRELAVGRINKETGDRILPTGRIAKDQRGGGANDGRYWGSSTQAPVTSLSQVGVIWSSAS